VKQESSKIELESVSFLGSLLEKFAHCTLRDSALRKLRMTFVSLTFLAITRLARVKARKRVFHSRKAIFRLDASVHAIFMYVLLLSDESDDVART